MNNEVAILAGQRALYPFSVAKSMFPRSNCVCVSINLEFPPDMGTIGIYARVK